MTQNPFAYERVNLSMTFLQDLFGSYLFLSSLLLGYVWTLSNDAQKRPLVPYVSLVWLLWCIYMETTVGLLAGLMMRVFTEAYYHGWVGHRLPRT